MATQDHQFGLFVYFGLHFDLSTIILWINPKRASSFFFFYFRKRVLPSKTQFS